MPAKKKKYNSRFPPARIKKIMQSDEEVGKVAAPVPVIISRALELFVETLLKQVNEVTIERGAKTVSPGHIKMCIHSEARFDFLKELVEPIPDLHGERDDTPSINALYPPNAAAAVPNLANNQNSHQQLTLRKGGTKRVRPRKRSRDHRNKSNKAGSSSSSSSSSSGRGSGTGGGRTIDIDEDVFADSDSNPVISEEEDELSEDKCRSSPEPSLTIDESETVEDQPSPAFTLTIPSNLENGKRFCSQTFTMSAQGGDHSNEKIRPVFSDASSHLVIRNGEKN